MRGQSAIWVVCAALTGIQCGDSGDTMPQLGPCAAETRAQTYAAGITRPGREGRLSFQLLSAEPGPPDRGDNRWVLAVTPIAPETRETFGLTVSPWMPDHGHGTTPMMHVATSSGSSHVFDAMDLFMSGFWAFTLTATDADGLVDEGVFSFCIEG